MITKRSDKIYYDLLKKNIQKIEDDSFTDRIVEIHLATKKSASYKPFLNFNLLIIGMSSVIISIGFIFSIIGKIELIKNLAFTEQYGLILLVISLLFLIFFWLENIVVPKKRITDKI